jgi:hypothetical protein
MKVTFETFNALKVTFRALLATPAVGFAWSARLDGPTGAVIASGSTTLTIPVGSRVAQPVSFTTPASGSRVFLVLSTSKSGTTMFSDTVDNFTLGSTGPAPA